MKKQRITLFGVPTLFTVLIVVLIISFSTLSYLNTLNVKHSIERGNRILEDTYTIQKDMELKVIDLRKKIYSAEYAFAEIEGWTYDREHQWLSRFIQYKNLRLDVKLQITQAETSILDVIEWKLTAGNNQDYTQDGDPVYGG